MASSPTAPAAASTCRVNTRTASSRGSGTGPPSRSAAMTSAGASSAVSRAVCMATQISHPFRVATVMMTVSRASGSSVAASNSAVIFPNASSSCGDAAHRAMAAGR